jgi:hypothetical protein
MREELIATWMKVFAAKMDSGVDCGLGPEAMVQEK